jgi:hypothetical protein
VVLEVTAKDTEDNELFKKEKKWFEIGIDPDKDMRYGAWQIKEIIDLTLPPLQTQREQYLVHFDTDTDEVTINAKLWYFISGGKGEIVYEETRTLEY